MGDITVGGNTYKVDDRILQEDNKYGIDADGDKKLTEEDVILTESEMQRLLHGMDPNDTVYSLKDITDNIDADRKDIEADALLGRIEDAADLLEKIKEAIEKLEANQQLTDAEKKGLETLKAEQARVEKEIKSLVQTANAKGLTGDQATALKDLKARLVDMKAIDGDASDGDGLNIRFSSSGEGDAPQGGGNGQRMGQGGAGGAPQTGGGIRFGWGAGPGAGGAAFSMEAFANSAALDQAALEGWDSVGKNASEQRKMMMLFFYFARMAMSGDMGAMYRFMHFITYIISKDKALQNIHMASKLIEMEDASRKAMRALLDTPTPENGNDAASYEFTRVMQETKQVQSEIATSQKLIAQMMEEMAQVVETLTGATKSALDANGRILQRLTRG